MDDALAPAGTVEQRPDFFISHPWGEPVLNFIANVERHAKASHVSVDLRGHRQGATLRIADNLTKCFYLPVCYYTRHSLTVQGDGNCDGVAAPGLRLCMRHQDAPASRFLHGL